MMTPWQRLWNDDGTWLAVDQLLDRGMCEDYVYPMIQQIAALPELHRQLEEETPEARKKRRGALADELLKMACKVEKDPEAKHFRYVDYYNLKNVTRGGRERMQMTYFTLAEVLRDAAEEIQKPSRADINNEYLQDKQSTRPSLKNFVRREIAELLIKLLNNPEKNPRAAATYLTNAILGVDTVTTEDLRENFRQISRGGGIK